MAAEEIVCPMCGFKNASQVGRCVSCGARIEALGPGDLSPEELHAKRHQQEGFVWKWVFISSFIYLFLQAIILGALPLAIATYDPQGAPGLLISGGVWFVGGIFVGFISPGKTFIEPVVGAMIAAVPTVVYLMSIADVRPLSPLAAVIGGLLGVMITLFGAFIGEKMQMGLRGTA